MRKLILILVSPAFIFIIYDIIFYYLPIRKNDYVYIPDIYIAYMIFCDFLALCSYFIFSSVLKEKTYVDNKRYKTIHNNWYVLFFLIILFFYNFLVASVFGSINYQEVFTQYAKFYALSKRGTAWVFSIFNLLIFIMIYDIYKGGGNKIKISILLLSLLLIGLTGGRSLLVIFVIFLLFIFIVLQRKKIDLKWLTLTAFFVLLIFLGNAFMRAGDINDYFSSDRTKFDYNAAFILNDTFEHLESNSSKFYMLEDLYYTFIPRSLSPSKPFSTAETRAVYPIVASHGTNYTFGIYANALLNVGLLSYLVIPLSIILMNYYYLKLSNRIIQKNIFYFFWLFLLFYSIQIIRGGIFNTRLIITLLPIIVAYFIYLIIPKKAITK